MDILRELSIVDIRKCFIDLLENEKLIMAQKCLPYLGESGVNFGQEPFPDIKENTNPLIRYAAFGKINCVKLLVQLGVDVNYLSNHKTTAIMYVFQNGFIEIVIHLLNVGARIQINDEKMTDFYNSTHMKKYMKLLDVYHKAFSIDGKLHSGIVLRQITDDADK